MPRLLARAVLVVLLAAALASTGLAQSLPYDAAPTWKSSTGGVSTGGAFADIDRDGWPDLVVANGNDIQRQRVVVHYNQGGGTFNKAPDWKSADIDYHGQLSVGDVNQDGWPDVAVAVFLGPSGFGSKGKVKLYLNDGAGTLSSLPAWTSADTFFSFSVRLGDADGDGDLDLAVATGEPYYDPPDYDRIYLNQGGTLQPTPGWLSSISEHSLDVTFADVDDDGDLDLVTCGALAPNRVYLSSGGLPATTPGWSSTDNPNQNGNSLTVGDLTGDRFLDLVVSDNNQLTGGQGVFKVYAGSAAGFATSPFWSSYGGMVSSVALADVLVDGFPDLATGAWWGQASLWSNSAGTLPSSPTWQMSGSSVQETMFFADLNRDGVRLETGESFAVDGIRKAFRLAHVPAEQIVNVTADGKSLGMADYCFDLEEGWIALKTAPTSSLLVDYRWSEALDLGVTNWDSSKGNYVWVRAPLVDATLTAPPAVVKEGQNLAFTVEIENTTAKSQPHRAFGFLFTPFGPVLLAHYHPGPTAPFASTSTPYSVPVPVGLPTAAHGSYLYQEYVVEDGALIVDQPSFSFSIHP